MLHEKTQASIFLEMDLTVCPESYYYYYLKYVLGCIVCISNGSLNLILFILTHVIWIVLTHVPVSKPSLAK